MKRTLEKREYEARIAKNQIADARGKKEKLAKEMLNIFMHQFANLAARFQPTINGQPNADWDEKRYKEWGLAAVDVAKALAPYQSPTFKSIGIAFQDVLVSEQGGGDDEPVRYPTLEEVRNELARRGLPPLRHLIESVVIDEQVRSGNGHDDGSGG
jgi:hypothetical protein